MKLDGVTGLSDLVRSRRLELPRDIIPQRPQRCASTSSATTANSGTDVANPPSRFKVAENRLIFRRNLLNLWANPTQPAVLLLGHAAR